VICGIGTGLTEISRVKRVLAYTPALAALVYARGIRRALLTITDEREFASATVVLECDG